VLAGTSLPAPDSLRSWGWVLVIVVVVVLFVCGAYFVNKLACNPNGPLQGQNVETIRNRINDAAGIDR